MGETPRRVRVAVVGAGWAGRAIWLPRLAAHPAFEVAAVVDPDPAARASAAVIGGGTPAYQSVDDLSADSVDLAVVAVPNHLHGPVATRVLRNGVASFVEKPVCLTSAEAARLADAERAGGAVLLAGSAARYRADVRCLGGLVATLGEIRHIDVAWVRARGVPEGGGWFVRSDLAGGGALLDLGWHLLDTVLPLLGTARVDQVIGTTSADFVNAGAHRAAWRHDVGTVSAHAGQGPSEGVESGDVEDTARGFLVTDNGISVALHASWASHAPLDTTSITVDGTLGSAMLRCTFGFSPNRHHTSVLTHTRDGETVDVPLAREPVGVEYDHQIDALPALLAAPGSRGAAIAEARQTIDIIERVYRSARRERTRHPLAPVHHTHRLAATVGGLSGGVSNGVSSEVSGGLSGGVPGQASGAGERRVRAVVFDLDGVVVDSTAVMREAFAVAYAEVVGDGPAPFDEYSRHLGRYFPDIMRIMGLPMAMEAPFVRESSRLAHLVPMFPGVVETLQSLRGDGIALAVATGKSGGRARSLLSTLGILAMFEHVIGSDEVSRPKPAPDIVLRALDLLDVGPAEAMMVGDAVTDLASAQGAGVTAVAALWGPCDEAAMLAARPDAVVRAPAELLALCSAVPVG